MGALEKFETLKAIYSRWVMAKDSDEFKRKRKGLPLIPIDQLIQLQLYLKGLYFH